MTLNLRRWATTVMLTVSLFGLTKLTRADLLGFWDFNTSNAPAPELALDQSGHLNNGLISGAKYTASGKDGQGISFKGGADTIQLLTANRGGFNGIGTNNAVTVSFWWNGDATAEDPPLNQSMFWAEPNRSFQAHVPWSDGNVYFDTAGCCDGNTQRISGPVDPSQWRDGWHNWVFIKNGDDKIIYVDGQEFLSGTNTGAMPAPTGGIWLGSANGNNSSYGLYDDFAIWDEGLSAKDVGTLFTKGVRALEPSLPTTTAVDLQMDLDVSGGKLVGRVVGNATVDGKTQSVTATEYTVSQKFSYVLKEPGVTPQLGGLSSTWLRGNLTSDGAWDAALANPSNDIVPPFFLDKISYGNDTPNGYPSQTGLTGNVENYSAQWKGEIFIPKGTINFRDGNDDYAKLVIDGNTLIDDNNWTSWDGTQNGGGGVGSFDATKSDATVDGLKGGWYPITFRGSEGGGGDNFRLVWDATDKGISAPDDVAFANPDTAGEFFTVGSEFFRAVDPGLVSTVIVPLGFNSAQGSIGMAGKNGLGSDGVNAEIPLNGATIPLSGNVTLLLNGYAAGLSKTLEKTVTFGSTGGCSLAGDVNCDNKVDLTDFGILKDNFGKSGAAGGAGAAVPEPSSLVLLCLGGLLGLATLVRKRNARV
jgi:hypothetical protein